MRKLKDAIKKPFLLLFSYLDKGFDCLESNPKCQHFVKRTKLYFAQDTIFVSSLKIFLFFLFVAIFVIITLLS